jgi:hypothetical protein
MRIGLSTRSGGANLARPFQGREFTNKKIRVA